jgi:stress-induced-phosphoprotein 1
VKIAAKKAADAKKLLGNDFYKKKDFQNALANYQEAIDICPTDMTYYNNKAAVYFEMKDFESCI